MDRSATPAEPQKKRYRWLYSLEATMEAPMFLLGLVWLWLLIQEFTSSGLSPLQDRLLIGIWVAFVCEFVLKLTLSSRKLTYISQNWITVIALVVPALRVFRALRALSILRASSVTSTTRMVRSLTSARRFATDLKEAQGLKDEGELNVGVLLTYTVGSELQQLENFATTLASDVTAEMQQATGLSWHFHLVEPDTLETNEPRMPSDYLDSASMHMAEGPFDLMLVITDVALMSRKRRVEAGLASLISHTLIISTRKLTTAARGEQPRRLSAAAVRWNAAALLLRLLGRISGLKQHGRKSSDVMAPYVFRPDREDIPRFNALERQQLHKRSSQLPERELHGGNALATFIFHILMVLKHPWQVFSPLLRNGAFLLALSLPGLATAAVAPTFLLVFTAEIWDVGLNMSNRTAAIYAVCSILGASFYLVRVQTLFFPRKEKSVLTEHLALANAVIFLSILLACIGLFVMVTLLMLVLEIYIFPPGLMNTWPTLEAPQILFGDKFRLAAFIATVGVTTGALAGGLESRTLIRHLALFRDRP